MTVAELLRAEIPSVAAEWRARCSASASSPAPEAADLDAVVLAVTLAVDDAPLPSTASRPALDWVAEILLDQATSLEETIHQLGSLREVLTERMVARLGPDAGLEAQHRLNAAVDGLVEACAAHTSRRLEQAAFVDPLTGLLNRRAMERDLRRELAVAARHGRRLSVIVGDLDRLKELNDRQGHAAGDRALCSLADALRAGLRAGDSAYRLGGDEFLVLLPETAADDVDAVVSRILTSGPPSFSWGTATFPDDAADGASLIHVADRRLFARRRVARSGPRLSTAPIRPRRREPHLLASLRLAAALMAGALLGAASVSGATGTLPDAAQDIVHTALDKVGVRVPPGTAADRSDESQAGEEDVAKGTPRFVGDATTSCTNPDGSPFSGTHGDYVAAHPDDPRTAVNERELAARSPCGKPISAVAGAEPPAPNRERDTQPIAGEGDSSGDAGPPAGAARPAETGNAAEPKKGAENGKTVEPVTRVDRDTTERGKSPEDRTPAKAREPEPNDAEEPDTAEPGEQDGGSVDAGTQTEPPRPTRAGSSRQARPR